jgi:hypothetical protein
MAPDGSGQTRLTDSPGMDAASPVGHFPLMWSPDGDRMAFISDRDNNLDVYTVNADGSSETRLTTNANDDLWPIWSPDGKEIAFLSNGNLYSVNVDGSGLTRLTTDIVAMPSWGTFSDPYSVAVVSGRGGGGSPPSYLLDIRDSLPLPEGVTPLATEGGYTGGNSIAVVYFALEELQQLLEFYSREMEADGWSSGQAAVQAIEKADLQTTAYSMAFVKGNAFVFINAVNNFKMPELGASQFLFTSKLPQVNSSS